MIMKKIIRQNNSLIRLKKWLFITKSIIFILQFIILLYIIFRYIKKLIASILFNFSVLYSFL